MVYCILYTEEDLHAIVKLIETFSDQTVTVLLGKNNTNLLGMVTPTIFRHGKPIFMDINESKHVPALKVDNMMIFFELTSDGEVHLFEKYNPDNMVTLTHSVGTWTIKSGLNMTKGNIWERRDNLYGRQLRVAVLRWPPFFDFTLNEEGLAMDAKGFLVDILQQLARNLNFTILMKTPNDGQWGSITESNEYTGLVRQLLKKEADIAPSGLYILKWREEVIDFAIPLLEDLQTLIAKKSSGKEVDFTGYIDIFMPEAWIMVCFSLISMSCINYVIRFVDEEQQTNTLSNLLSSVAAAGRQLMQMPYRLSNYNDVSTRMILFVIAMHSYVLFTYYTCNLTAAMTTTTPKIGVSSFEDAIRYGYKVLVIDGSAYSVRVKDEGLDLVIVQPSQGTSDAELLINKMSQESKTLIFQSSLSFFGRSDFYPMSIKEAVTKLVAFGLQQDSEYRQLFNYNLQKLHDAGILDYLARMYMPTQGSLGAIEEAVPLGYDNVLFPSLVMFTGIFSSLLIVCFEKIGRFITNRKTKCDKKLYPGNDEENNLTNAIKAYLMSIIVKN